MRRLRHTPKGGITTNDKEDLTINKNVDRIPVTQKTAIRSIRKAISPYFSTVLVPLEKPVIEKDFRNISHIERITESMRYNILCLEYSISPKGGIRQWIKVNLALFILIGIPLLIFTPLITYFIGSVAEISELLFNASQYLFEGALNIIKLIGHYCCDFQHNHFTEDIALLRWNY